MFGMSNFFPSECIAYSSAGTAIAGMIVNLIRIFCIYMFNNVENGG